MEKTSARRATLACALLVTTAFCGLTAAPAAAQTGQAAQPAFRQVDANGVDLVTGKFHFSMVEGVGETAATAMDDISVIAPFFHSPSRTDSTSTRSSASRST